MNPNETTPRQSVEAADSTFARYVDGYTSSAAPNDALWLEFTQRTSEIAFLDSHRTWVETNAWGFGDRAFHFMWYVLLRDDVLLRKDPSLLEIGVYKGQVVSLWALIAKQLDRRVKIAGVSPFKGDEVASAPPFMHRIWRLVKRRFEEDWRAGNIYEVGDYFAAIDRIFSQFGLDASLLEKFEGLSEAPEIKDRIAKRRFDVVYIDAGHRYDQASHDIAFYGDLVTDRGYLVLDDASCSLPGTLWFKGREGSSRAADELGPPVWRNVLNVGHNRIFQRIDGGKRV